MSDETFLPSTYAESALVYVQQGFKPIPVKGKKFPPGGATGYEGSITRDKVDAWLVDPEWADKNLAIVGDGWIGIDVDAYDDKNGAQQLAELEQALGPLPATPSSTSRGGDQESRIHFFEVPKESHFLDHAAPDIEVIQASHRYAIVWPSFHPETGSQYTWYDADGEEMSDVPNVSDFERLPEAWYEFLYSDPATPVAGFSGTVEEWLGKLNQGSPNSRVKAWMSNIPTENFDHTDVVKITYNIVRLGAEGEPGIREALNYLYDMWVKPPFDGPKYVKELSIAIQGAIRKGGNVQDIQASLPDFWTAMQLFGNKIPQDINDMALYGSDPESLLQALYAQGLDMRDAAAIAWQGTAKRAGLEFEPFWDLVVESHSRQQAVQIAKSPEGSKFSLLSMEEREQVDAAENWMTKYMRYARSMVPDGYLNEPFHRLAGWVVASMTFGIKGKIERDPQPMPLNVYMTGLGPSSTGKTDAEKSAMAILKEFFKNDAGWDMGSNSSAAAMQRHLIDQDKKATLFHDDEASGPLNAFFEQKGFQDLPARITKWHDGEVSPMFRTVEKDINGKSAEAHLCMWMYGTPEEVFKVISKEHFMSGFLARMIWAIGEPRRAGHIEYKIKFRDANATALGHNPAVVELAEHLHALSERLDMLQGAGGYVPLKPANNDVLKRALRAGTRIINLFDNHQHYAVLEPSLKRMMDVVWKTAGLLALADSRDSISMDDILYAVREAEQWLPSLEHVANNLNNSYHARQAGELLDWMRRLGKTDVPMSQVYRRLESLDNHQANRLIDSLVAQGRITKEGGGGSQSFLRLVKEGIESTNS